MRIADCGLRVNKSAAARDESSRSRRGRSRLALLSSSIRNPQSAIRKRRVRHFLQTAIFVVAFASHAFASSAWSVQSSGTLAWLRAVYFLDAQHGWAAGSKGTLVSTEDGGRTWRAHARPTEDALRDLFFTDAATGWLVCERDPFKLASLEEQRSYLLKTTDGGASWSRVDVTSGANAELVLTRVVFADAERGWVMGETGALYATRDGGATWTRQRVPTQRLLLGASFLDPAQGWLVGAGATILQTSDGGAQWQNASTLPADTARLNAVSFADARRGWAVGAGGTILSTADGGHTWRRQQSNTDADLSDVSFVDAREGWAVGADGFVLHTMDGGATWEMVASPTRHPLERLAFVSRERGWAVGFGGTIISYAPAHDAPPRLKN
jgi:photosystem II stability/assembly factor-like uncharacterized protein